MFSLVHDDSMESWNVFFFWPNNLPTIKSLSINTEARFAVSLAEILYENIPLTEMTFQSQGSTCMLIAFTGSTSYARICVACLRLTTLPRRVVNAGCPKKVHIYTYIYMGIFVLRTGQSVKLVSFVRQVLNLDFDTLFLKIGQKLTEL